MLVSAFLHPGQHPHRHGALPEDLPPAERRITAGPAAPWSSELSQQAAPPHSSQRSSEGHIPIKAQLKDRAPHLCFQLLANRGIFTDVAVEAEHVALQLQRQDGQEVKGAVGQSTDPSSVLEQSLQMAQAMHGDLLSLPAALLG